MYKVRINYCGSYGETIFETEMPEIPKRKDNIGFWHATIWIVAKVHSVVYEFSENSKYELTEINLRD